MAKKFKSYQRNAGSNKVRRGDRVIVLSGKSKGHIGEIIRVDNEKNKVYVEGAMIQKVSNRVAQMRNANQGAQTGGIIEREGPIHVSNVALVDPKDNKATRVRVVREDGTRSRRAARSGQKLD
ncbi:MAG: 50S ribosomal protein L24 [Solirubrobacterales bacterium]